VRWLAPGRPFIDTNRNEWQVEETADGLRSSIMPLAGAGLANRRQVFAKNDVNYNGHASRRRLGALPGRGQTARDWPRPLLGQWELTQRRARSRSVFANCHNEPRSRSAGVRVDERIID
jgi:hypothetical protein